MRDVFLAFTGAITVAKGILGGTTNRITSISGFACNGTEPSLSACPVVSGAASTCSLAASVVCQLRDVARAGNCTHGDIRLVNGTSQINGRFEVCINNAWGTMCSEQIFSKEAAVVCRQLNASNPNIRVNAAGQYNNDLHLKTDRFFFSLDVMKLFNGCLVDRCEVVGGWEVLVSGWDIINYSVIHILFNLF